QGGGPVGARPGCEGSVRRVHPRAAVGREEDVRAAPRRLLCRLRKADQTRALSSRSRRRHLRHHRRPAAPRQPHRDALRQPRRARQPRPDVHERRTGQMVNPLLFATVFKLFGSTGAEAQLTPANPASPLLRGNTSTVAAQTNSADAVAYIQAWNLHLKLRGEASDRASDSARVSEAFVQFAPRPWLTIAAGRILDKRGT